MVWGIALVRAASCLGCVPSQLLLHPGLLAGGVVCEAEKALTLCKHSPAITKTSLCYQHCFQHKSKTQPRTSYCEEN